MSDKENKNLNEDELKSNQTSDVSMGNASASSSNETEKGNPAVGEPSDKRPVYVRRSPPCTEACPAGEDIRGFHNIIRSIETDGSSVENDTSFDNWAFAWQRIVENNPFPAVMGRVCPAPCENACNRNSVDQTVGINSVEHAIGQYGIDNKLSLKNPHSDTGKTIGIVGAGPAGLSAAYQLRQRGHSVTIYEARDKTGGMMRYGIMGYRVDRNILDAEINRILSLGIELQMGVRIGKELSISDLEDKHDAVFIGIGAQTGKTFPVKGFDKGPYTISAIDFLIGFESEGEKLKRGKEIIIIGDGDVAMDVARLALRLGSQATVISAVERKDMNCTLIEYNEAVAEGAKIEFNVSVTEVIKSGLNVSSVKAKKMQKKTDGEEGWNSDIPFLRYKPLPDSEFEIECDMVVVSIGQTTDNSGFEDLTDENGHFQVDHNYKIDGKQAVFAGGDSIKIDLITTAVGHGRKAALTIDSLLQEEGLQQKTEQETAETNRMKPYFFQPSEQAVRTHANIENIKGNFNEILQPLSKEWTEWESNRCMSCGLCFNCKQCLLYCPVEAITYSKNNPIGDTMHTDYNKCIGCHICSEICPCGYIDMVANKNG